MTKIDILYIGEGEKSNKAILSYGDCCRIYLYKTKSYTWITVSLKSLRMQQALMEVLSGMKDTIDITYVTYAGTTTLRQVPRLVRQQAEGDWRYFKLRI